MGEEQTGTTEEVQEKVGFTFDLKWIIATIVIPLIIWCTSIEVRMYFARSDQVKLQADQTKEALARVAQLETYLTPVLIEYGVRQELAKKGDKSATPVVEENKKPVATKPEFDKYVREQTTKINSQFPNRAKN